MNDQWHKTACILCSVNCGVEVKLEGRHITRVRGNREHVASHGYACEKAQRLDYYQNAKDRIDSPLRRRADGTFEKIDWDTAIREIAERLVRVRDTHGGASIFYYGGGGQGNHLCGAYSVATRRALGMVYSSNALAQEKTGEFWVDARLYGGRPAPDFEHAEVAMFVGKNPWQSHGFQTARPILKSIAADPNRALIVIDPRRSETAEMADYHLQVRPGADAFCLSAILATLVQEDIVNHDFLREHASGGALLFDVLRNIPIAEYSARAGVAENLVREVARRIARAASVSILEDLGIEMSPHSTLNSYLEKLLFVLSGNFGRKGGMNLHTSMGKLVGKVIGNRRSPVGGHLIIGGMIPCNVIPDEILTDHPRRFRAMIVESANPIHSLADSKRMREALDALDTVVVIDVAMTETARHAHYVLPASSQFEKWETTFFAGEFPSNYFCLRAPIIEPMPGTLPEAEIHARLVRAIGALKDVDLSPLHEAAAIGRLEYAIAFQRLMSSHPKLGALAPIVLYETLGPTLGKNNEVAAILWGAAQNCATTYADSIRRAGFKGEGPALGNALFDAIFKSRDGVTFSIDDYEETFRRIETPEGRIQIDIPELIDELKTLPKDKLERDPAFPFILAAGERRSTTANTIMRNPEWRPKDRAGSLRMSPRDAESLGLKTGGRVRITTRRGSAEAVVELSDRLQPGHVTLPNGAGLSYPDANGRSVLHGVAPNELTASDYRDWLAGTPFHKHVPARIEAV
ncbi:MAG: molybdopterin-dependent oxidoreductase [Candidatus Binatus sp.]|uniref:molybdopterin-dependent oxidoreductase n=1 Tax=Candidatus Binatus sp. TaxID=2811406 RepID=UPI0027213872|nr:molybdopterin-dependent oxidoreductase [Candidatus Binatus sp.]MDO8432805.1 molybdopterin-dependent oxidoreductase [Candidatus Binatus sp.]